MISRPPATTTELSSRAFTAAIPTLLEIYTGAMGYRPETGSARAPLWAQHAQRPGFRCVVATPAVDSATTAAATAHQSSLSSSMPRDIHDVTLGRAPTCPPGPILGFSYGYLGAPGQWWHNEVARGLRGHQSPWLADYFELTELHVAPRMQGSGIGQALLLTLLAPVAATHVLLSTPEGDSRAWRLYRRLGFGDVLREFRFTGDGRAFGVLGRSLPMAPPS